MNYYSDASKNRQECPDDLLPLPKDMVSMKDEEELDPEMKNVKGFMG